MNGLKRAIYEFDNFRLDAGERQLLRDGKAVGLSSKAFDLLLLLVENQGHLLSKDEIYSRIWRDQIVEESNLSVQISAVRRALGESRRHPHYIGTVIGSGYRFTAEVRTIKDRDDEKLISESGSVGRGGFEFEEETRKRTELEQSKNSAFRSFSRPLRFSASKILAALFFFVLMLGGYRLYQNYRQASSIRQPFQQINLIRVTNGGKIDGAAVSPDAKYAVLVLSDNDGNSIWLRQIGTASDIRILPPTPAEIWGVTFSPDGRFVYYSLFAGDTIDLELYRIPSLGGASEKIPEVSTRAVTFSPDGTRIAFIESNSALGFNYLKVTDADGKNPQMLAKKDYPNTFSSEGQATAWSPDGKTIACLVNQTDADGNYYSIVGINAADGSETILSERRWFEVSGIEWLKKGGGLLIAAKESLAAHTQIWMLPVPPGEPRRITNDLNEYSWLSAVSNGEMLAAIQTNTADGIYVGEAGKNDFREIASEIGALNPVVWTPDGKIVFRSSKDGVSNLWIMNADGSAQRQLTTNAQVDFRGLCISPDGKYLVFASWRSGKSNLWRARVEDGSLKQLTDGESDAFPNCLPDNQNVIFQRGIFSKPMLWKVSLVDGGQTRLTDFRAKWSAISADGSRLSFFQMTDEKWRIGIVSADGKNELNRLDAPPSLKGSKTQWSSDNQFLFYIQASGNVGNLWKLPLDGAPPQPVTDFKSHRLADFAVSPDGKNIAVTRSLSFSDVVLIENKN